MNPFQLFQKNFQKNLPLTKNILLALLAAGLTMNLFSCGKSNFTGSANEKPENANPTATPAPPSCKDQTVQTGVQLAFVIDNSGSNAVTDCDNTSGQCSSATQREKSVLAAFDYLQASSVSATTPTAKSQVAVSSFPKTSQDGFQIQSNWAVIENANQRASLEKSLLFTRSPYGNTPYGAAISAATEMFKTAAADGRPKVAILVTDGEPTDRNGVKVRDAATALQGTGVELYSIFITSGVNKDKRMQAHLASLQSFESDSYPGHYYDSTAYANFDAYADHILGRNGKKSLLEEISKTIISIDKADQLQSTIQALVKSKTECK